MKTPQSAWVRFGVMAVLLASISEVCYAQGTKPLVMAFDGDTSGQDNSGTSRDGSIKYELRKPKTGDPEIWLWPKGHKKNAVKLCETWGWGNMHLTFSPNNYWIIVEDGGLSLGISLTLFRRNKGVSYSEVKKPDINDEAEKLALRQIGLTGTADVLDHRYVELVRWSADSRRILIQLHGTGDNEKHHISIEGWLGVYDLGKHSFSFDLEKMNRGSVQKSNRNISGASVPDRKED